MNCYNSNLSTIDVKPPKVRILTFSLLTRPGGESNCVDTLIWQLNGQRWSAFGRVGGAHLVQFHIACKAHRWACPERAAQVPLGAEDDNTEASKRLERCGPENVGFRTFHKRPLHQSSRADRGVQFCANRFSWRGNVVCVRRGRAAIWHRLSPGVEIALTGRFETGQLPMYDRIQPLPIVTPGLAGCGVDHRLVLDWLAGFPEAIFSASFG